VLEPANDSLPILDQQGRGHPDDQVRVTVRLHRSEVMRLMRLARPWGCRGTSGSNVPCAGNFGIERARCAWRLSARRSWANCKQVLAIGRNINQAVHAMNAANQPGSTLEVARIAGTVPRNLRRFEGAADGNAASYLVLCWWRGRILGGRIPGSPAMSFRLSSGTLDPMAVLLLPSGIGLGLGREGQAPQSGGPIDPSWRQRWPRGRRRCL
jgi:hypothetical protein